VCAFDTVSLPKTKKTYNRIFNSAHIPCANAEIAKRSNIVHPFQKFMLLLGDYT
jgi:hypothetical protein